MSDQTSLLKTIEDNPHDDTVRLVYADWLAENGREKDALLLRIRVQPERDDLRLQYADWEEQYGCADRAEYIRLQIKRDAQWTNSSGECWPCHRSRKRHQRKHDSCRCSDEWRLMIERIHEIETEWRGAWFFSNVTTPNHHPLFRSEMISHIPHTDNPYTAYTINACTGRGFVDRIRIYGDDWVKEAAWLLDQHPITRVHLVTPPSISYIDDPDNKRRAYRLTRKNGRRALFYVDMRAFLITRDQEYFTEKITHQLCRAQWPKIKFGTWDG